MYLVFLMTDPFLFLLLSPELPVGDAREDGRPVQSQLLSPELPVGDAREDGRPVQSQASSEKLLP